MQFVRTLSATEPPTNTGFGGSWLGLHGPSGHYVGPHGCPSTCIVTK